MFFRKLFNMGAYRISNEILNGIGEKILPYNGESWEESEANGKIGNLSSIINNFEECFRTVIDYEKFKELPVVTQNKVKYLIVEVLGNISKYYKATRLTVDSPSDKKETVMGITTNRRTASNGDVDWYIATSIQLPYELFNNRENLIRGIFRAVNTNEFHELGLLNTVYSAKAHAAFLQQNLNHFSLFGVKALTDIVSQYAEDLPDLSQLVPNNGPYKNSYNGYQWRS